MTQGTKESGSTGRADAVRLTVERKGSMAKSHPGKCVICTEDGPAKDEYGNFEDVSFIILQHTDISAHPTCFANALRWVGAKSREEKRYRDKIDALEKELTEDCGPQTVTIPPRSESKG